MITHLFTQSISCIPLPVLIVTELKNHTTYILFAQYIALIIGNIIEIVQLFAVYMQLLARSMESVDLISPTWYNCDCKECKRLQISRGARTAAPEAFRVFNLLRIPETIQQTYPDDRQVLRIPAPDIR